MAEFRESIFVAAVLAFLTLCFFAVSKISLRSSGRRIGSGSICTRRDRAAPSTALMTAKAQQVRAFVDEVERRAQAKDKSTEPGAKLAEWIAWARRHADRLDPLKSPGLEDRTAGSQPGE